MREDTKLYFRLALSAKADAIERSDLPETDRLSKSGMQSEPTRAYFARHAEDLKAVIAELRAEARRP